MIRKKVCFWERMARELEYKVLTWGINWVHCQVKNNVLVFIEKRDTDLFAVNIVIWAEETNEVFGNYYYGPHRRRSLKENIEEFIKEREEDIKLGKATKRSS